MWKIVIRIFIIFNLLDECFDSFQMIIKIEYTLWREDPIKCRYMGCCECKGFNPHVMCADVCADCHHDRAYHLRYSWCHVVLCISTLARKDACFWHGDNNKIWLQSRIISTFISNLFVSMHVFSMWVMKNIINIYFFV